MEPKALKYGLIGKILGMFMDSEKILDRRAVAEYKIFGKSLL
jgi:hypothetical protein